MLDRNSIAQLSQLKQDIVASKDLAEGTVVGSNGRYGFVKLTDGRTAFLNPEKMQRVFPGDVIQVNVIKNDKDQLEAEFEALVKAPLTRFVGQYKVKGSAHFVVPMDKSITRWIFLPPQHRLKCKVDDFVLAEVTQHPYQDGKPAAKVIAHVGTKGTPFLEQNIVIAKYGLSRFWSKDAQAQANDCASAPLPKDLQDFTHLPLVTIDSASTRDMDDALYMETNDNGWTAWVAIADPASFISPGSPIAKSARYFAQTVYLPGRVLPMLPEGLGTEAFSLQALSKRSALVCRINIGSEGEILDFEFQRGVIQSRHKLTYQDVGAFLDGDAAALGEVEEDVKASLARLFDAAQVRLRYRQQHNLVFDDHVDYDWNLNKQGFIDSITKRCRNSANRVVEEAMIATNHCAGQFLSQHKGGVYSVQTGFRPERLGEVKALLREEFGESFDNASIEQPAGFIALVHQLQASDTHRHLLPALRRLMQAAAPSAEPGPHLGMGLTVYAPMTSPIRRYADLCNHWAIQNILSKGTSQALPKKLTEQMSQSIENARLANREIEQILMCEYLNRHIGLEDFGTVRIVTQQGFGVRLEDTGLEGFVQLGKAISKTFDAKRMRLQVGEHTFSLEQSVKVRVVSVDTEKRRVKLELAEINLHEASTKAQDKTPENT